MIDCVAGNILYLGMQIDGSIFDWGNGSSGPHRMFHFWKPN